MTTTPDPNSAPDPVLALLRELRDQEKARMEHEAEREKRAAATDKDREGFQRRTETALRDIRSELQRQDQQMIGFDRRISGNYVGITERLDILDDDKREISEILRNMERALVELSKSSRMVHGRMIEHSSSTGETFTEVRSALTELEARIGNAEMRLAKSEEPSVEAVENVAEG